MKDFRNEQLLVLVIDDDREVLDEVSGVLCGANLACCCCTTAKEALAAVEATLPDLILCDVHLHGESGVETCQQIKLRPGLEDVPLMYLSAAQLPDVIRRSDAAGGIYWLRKPFAANVLIELIDQALGVPEGAASL